MFQIGDIVRSGGVDWLVLGHIDGVPVGARSAILDDAQIVMEKNVVSHELARHINDFYGSLALNLVSHCSDQRLVELMIRCDYDIQAFNLRASGNYVEQEDYMF